jgi:IS30 family transposase
MEMYSHLTKKQRIELGALLRAGISLRQAAKLLGVHHCTLSRELRRNAIKRNTTVARVSRTGYHAGDAERATKSRRRQANQRFRKILAGSILERLLVEKIQEQKWAPEQCSGWLKTHRRSLYVCAQTIYDWIYLVKRELLPFLHCRKGKYRHTRMARLRKDKREELAAPRHISRRPASVDRRIRYGHWEGDTVHGAGKSGYIATFVERKSGYLVARLITTEQFNDASRCFAYMAGDGLTPIPAQYRKTLTLDNGPEMKQPELIERLTGVNVYYANPYHSWERGTNENTNGLLRYFFPRKMSFAHLTQEAIDQAVHLLNTRPRKRHNWRTPKEMLGI